MERNTVVLDLDRYHELLKLERDFESFKDKNMVFTFGSFGGKYSVNEELKQQSEYNRILKKSMIL